MFRGTPVALLAGVSETTTGGVGSPGPIVVT